MRKSDNSQVRFAPYIHGLHSFSNNVLWYSMGFATLISVNLHVTNVLGAIQAQTVDTSIRLAIGLSNFLALLLTGWLFFTIFLRPGNQGILPDKRTRSNNQETRKLILNFLYIELCRSSILQLGLIIAKSQITVNYYYFIGGGITAIVWSAIRFIGWRRNQQRTIPDGLLSDLLDASSLDTEIQAKVKFRRLTKEEQHELAEMVYKNDMVKRATVQTLAKILCGSLLVAFLLEILEKIIGQIIPN